MADLRGDMVLHDGDQGGIVKLASRNPRWELAVPDKGVAASLLLVSNGEISNLVTAGEVEDTTSGFSGFPFEQVRGHNLSKVVGVVQLLVVRRVLMEFVVVDGCSEVQLATRLGSVVQSKGVVVMPHPALVVVAVPTARCTSSDAGKSQDSESLQHGETVIMRYREPGIEKGNATKDRQWTRWRDKDRRQPRWQLYILPCQCLAN